MPANSGFTSLRKERSYERNCHELGQVVATPGVLQAFEDANQQPAEFIARHARLEQGALGEADYEENLFSLDKPLRIFSAYETSQGLKLWIITEADRSRTTILLPCEY